MAFPSESKDPRVAGGAELLEAVCPGMVTTGKGMGCLTGCSDDTAFGKFGDRFPWSLEAVTFGRFLSPTSEDAVLWMTGCEPHSLNFGGTILLTKSSKRWSMLWYKAGVQTARCHKAATHNEREILVCIGTAGGQGNLSTDLYALDLTNPKPTLMAGGPNDGTFFAAFDDTLTCGWQDGAKEPSTDPVIRTRIDKVEFSANRANGVPLISVTARFGKKQMTAEDVKACMAKQEDVLPSTKSYRMDFSYSGHDFEPAPSSAAAVGMFRGR